MHSNFNRAKLIYQYWWRNKKKRGIKLTKKQRNQIEKAWEIVNEVWEDQALKVQNMEEADMTHLPNFEILEEETILLEEVESQLSEIINGGF